MKRDIFLISNSTNAGEQYLGWIKNDIVAYCRQRNIKEALFVPYAGVNVGQAFDGKKINDSYDLYFDRVKNVFESDGLTLLSTHKCDSPIEKYVEKAECIIVGGGNTFHLVYELHRLNLMDCIRKRILEGCPYIGWSAGANIACPTMKTTNDMPVVEPKSFDTLGVVPFQINPHYLDANPEGHGGETREDRIREFLTVNPSVTVAGLREATALIVKDDDIKLIGSRSLRVFRYGVEPQEFSLKDDLKFLLE
ncbi:MAG: dipeptidase PepE [Bacteroidales bacterium]|jgi:dipeptidase E|nr:dipeptidase PepE [Bacteroidales bacterium]